MTGFRIAVIALLLALGGTTYAADASGDAEKLRGDIAKLSAENGELKKKAQESDAARLACLHIIKQMERASKDD